MMYQKALLFEDKDIAEEILAAEHPKDQKALGRIVKNFDNKKWNANRELIVEEGNWYKFTRAKQGGEELRRRLLETGDRELVEVTNFSLLGSESVLTHAGVSL